MHDRQQWLAGGGTSLIEVVVAIGLGAVLFASVAPVTFAAIDSVERARLRTRAAAAAASQIERLRALPWYHVSGGGVVVDASSRVGDDGFVAGGVGLSPALTDTLESTDDQYADQPIPSGLSATSNARLTRRWRVVSLPSIPDCVALIVEVAATLTLDAGQRMEDAALVRVQTVRCVAGARP